MICSEEHRRIVMLDEPNPEGSAMISNKVDVSCSRPQEGRNDPHPRRQQESREGLWCSYYKKPKYTRDTCFKLHGKKTLLNMMGGF